MNERGRGWSENREKEKRDEETKLLNMSSVISGERERKTDER